MLLALLCLGARGAVIAGIDAIDGMLLAASTEEYISKSTWVHASDLPWSSNGVYCLGQEFETRRLYNRID